MEGIKKNWIIFSVLITVAVIIIVSLVAARSSEDGWICSEGKWIRHGNPSSAMPETLCPGVVACTLDARICPDGSAVGRQGPNCEFAPCPSGEATSTGSVGMANPASANCEQRGGRLVMKTRGDGGQYGLCFFDDNRACEEWAMMRGDCPVGGVKTTGYDTEAQRYCAWSGGSTLALDNAVCTFKDGSKCDAEKFYNGECQLGSFKSSATITDVNGSKLYTNKEFGLSFSFPKTWIIEDNLPVVWQLNTAPRQSLSLKNPQNKTSLHIYVNSDGFGPLFPDITYDLKKQDGKLLLSNRRDVPDTSEEIGGVARSQRSDRQIIASGDNIMLIYSFDLNDSDGEAMFKKMVAIFSFTK